MDLLPPLKHLMKKSDILIQKKASEVIKSMQQSRITGMSLRENIEVVDIDPVIDLINNYRHNRWFGSRTIRKYIIYPNQEAL